MGEVGSRAWQRLWHGPLPGAAIVAGKHGYVNDKFTAITCCAAVCWVTLSTGLRVRSCPVVPCPFDDDWGVASHTLTLAWLTEPGLPWFTVDSAMDCHGELRAE
jgi:hypothetical protein